MSPILDTINTPDDVKKLNLQEKQKLAEEIREKIIHTVSKTGGHLASNLGVTELTIALHSVFSMPEDKIIWDVGHQTYVHKLLTGRKDKFDTLRTLGGIAGFPKTKESIYDCFDTGHSSTSISVALGMARARDLQEKQHDVVAVIGDGALTGGMALEALNDAGNSKTRLIVVLNDNEMSISKNVGGISRFLTKMRTKKFYKKSNNFIRKILEKTPMIGNPIILLARKVKYSIKQLFLPNMFFEDLGFKYLGPVDGHDIERVEWILRLAQKEKEQPVLVHIITKKGKGYPFAEKNPDKFHATGPFDEATGKSEKEKQLDYSHVMGEKLVELAQKDNRIVAITAAMADGTGLAKFKENFPDRFFDVGIAEQHALSMAAGMAREGLRPVVPIYSSFYQRAYDQVIHDVCLQKLPVVMCVDRAGIVGADGETHQGIYDLSFMQIVPNLVLMAPKDFKELEDMLTYAFSLHEPVVIRYPRGGQAKEAFTKHEKIEKGKAEILQEGKDISIIAIGNMVEKAMEYAKSLQKYGKEAEVINVRFLKPLDENTLLKSIQKTKRVITIEDNILKGGLASSVMELIVRHHLQDITIETYGYPDAFIPQGSVEELEKIYGCFPSLEKEMRKRKENEQARNFIKIQERRG